jgi:hypothetical protein
MNDVDLEITRKCALAMGLPVATKDSWARFDKSADEVWIHKDKHFDGSLYQYNPLINDNQVTQLVKHFGLSVERGIRSFADSYNSWHVQTPLRPNWVGYSETWNVDYNRAICECVANIK